MLIDVSIPLDDRTPAFPGDPHISITTTGDIDTGYQGQQISLASHTGTHVDAPLHMIKDGMALNQIPLEQFYGKMVLFSVSGDNYSLTDKQLETIGSDTIVVFRTGASDDLYSEHYFANYPVMSKQLATELALRKVKLVGMDTPSADKGGVFSIHHILLGAGIPIIENLYRLDNIPEGEHTFYGFPIALQADGAPLRAIVEVQS